MSSEHMNLEQLEQKVYRDSLQDGIMDILMGCLLVACGLWIADSRVGGAFLGLYVIGAISLHRAHEALKRRFTYPRLGKAVLHQEKPGPLVSGILVFIVATAALVPLGLALLGRLTTAEWYRWLPVWIGFCLIGAMAHLYSKSGSPRFIVYAVLAVGAGFAAGSLRLPGKMDNIAVYLICLGAFFALVGVVMLIRFLRSHPVAVGTEEGMDDQQQG
jgi:hypothetical protein